MSDHRFCIVKESPLPEREYRVAPARCWNAVPGGRAYASSVPRRARPRRRSLLPLLLLGLVLFGCGFLLGTHFLLPYKPERQVPQSYHTTLFPAHGCRPYRHSSNV